MIYLLLFILPTFFENWKLLHLPYTIFKSCNGNTFISKLRLKRFRRKLPSLFENLQQLVNLKNIFSSEKNLPESLYIFQPTVKLSRNVSCMKKINATIVITIIVELFYLRFCFSFPFNLKLWSIFHFFFVSFRVPLIFIIF